MSSESSYEKLVYKMLESLGRRFERQTELPGYSELSGRRHKYDAVLWEERIVIEVDGCWYHGCKRCFSPLKGWQLDANRKDARIDRVTRRLGWAIRRIKIHSLDVNPAQAVARALRPAKRRPQM
jgi:G:T-mismatch repair DNA endonuclease (very short patch repair protein)